MTFLRHAYLSSLLAAAGIGGGTYLLIRGYWYGWIEVGLGVLFGLLAALLILIVKDFAR